MRKTEVVSRKEPLYESPLCNGILVDDEIAQLVAYKELLAAWGFDVDVASSLAAALEKFGSRSYQFALLDFAIGGVGETPAQLIVMLQDLYPQCKILIITAYPEQAETSLGSFQIPIWEKPIDCKKLVAWLEQVKRLY